MKSTKVVIADDHHIFRMGLVQVIENCKNCALAGEAADGETALKMIRKLKPGIAVLDISMPALNGLEVCRAVKKAGLKTDIIILSMHNDFNYLNDAIDAGAKGYILKSGAVEELITALAMVAGGKPYITPVLLELLLEQKRQRNRYLDTFPRIKSLTRSEHQVLKLIARRMTSKEVAKELSISYRTVQKHRANICAKLGLQGWNGLLHFAQENAASL